MTICVLAVGRLIINEVLHDQHSQILISELGKIRQTIFDSLSRSGVRAATRTAAALHDSLKTEPLQLKTGHIYIIEAPDRVIFHPEYDAGERVNFNDLETLFEQREGTVEYRYQGEKHFAAFTTIYPLEWIVLLSIDEREMYAEEAEYLLQIIFIAIVIFCISALVVSLFVRRFVQRLQTTIDCIKKIEDGDLEARVVYITADDEIGRLQSGVNAMSARIQARTFEQKMAEQALRESETKYRQLFDTANEGIWVQDEEFKTTFVNEHLVNMLGYTQDELQGHQVTEFLFEEDVADHWQKMEERREKHSEMYERRIRRKDGSTVWMLISATPVFDDNGNFHGSFAMLTDISERKEAEQQLAASEQLFRTLVENSPDYFARYDLELNRVYINPTLQKLFEAPASKILGNPSVQASPLNDPKRYMDCIRQVIETADEVIDEFTFRIHDAETHWASIRFAPEFDLDGKVESVLAISHDITKLKSAEQERQEHLLFLENLDRINLVLQEEGDIEQVMNKTLDEVLGIFDCDRVYMLYPCDPGSPTWSVPLERCKPGYPGVLEMGVELPVNDYIAWEMSALLDSDHPVRVGPGSQYEVADFLQDQFNIRSFMAMALYPQVDKPWQLGIHQCSHERIWTDQEMQLFEEIGHRLSDGLNNLLITRNLRESEERFRLVFENSAVPIWEEDFSAAKSRMDEIEEVNSDDIETYLTEHPEIVRECAALVRIVNVNNAALELHETDSKEGLLAGLPGTFIPESYDAFRNELVAIAHNKTEILFDTVVQTLTGIRREVSVYYVVCPGYEQSLTKVFVSLIDITERKYAEERIRLAASVFASSQEGILISDADNCIIDINPAFTRLTGYSREEALGQNPRFLSAGKESKEFYAEMWKSINTFGEWQGELWNRRKSGEVFPEQLSIVAVKDEQGRLQHYVGSFSDISVIKQHEADLDRIAHYDVLTSVPNRRLLGDRLEQAIAHAKRHGKSFAVCYLDLDGFKPINDEFGHEGGDRMLIEISNRLESMSRAEDTVARLGGDEFVLLWNDIGEEADCIQALERILDRVSLPMLLEGEPVSVSASIGVTLYPNDNVDAENLLRHADHAMYSAKQLGKNRYQMFDARLERQISARVDLLAKVARGLDEGQFELYYQPKVDYVAGTVNGLEALLRWNDPILGLVGPKEFLSLIENDSLAFRMGRWVME